MKTNNKHALIFPSICWEENSPTTRWSALVFSSSHFEHNPHAMNEKRLERLMGGLRDTWDIIMLINIIIEIHAYNFLV